MLARAAEFARVIGDPRIDEHAIGGLHVGDTGADGLYDARPVRSHDVREFSACSGQAFRYEQIEMIQRRRANRDAYLTRLGSGRVWNLGDLELVDTAGGGEHAGTHSAP